MDIEALTFRPATEGDLPAIVSMLADDALGAAREDATAPLSSAYTTAFKAIATDPNQNLIVAVSGTEVLGTIQITFIPGLSHKGATRGQLETVRVRSDHRSKGVGEQLFRWSIEFCRAHGCAIVQLTSDQVRTDAHRFYERLGFKQSHFGYKLWL